MMVAIMRRYKAAPGFSKHTGETAVDFMTVDDGTSMTANSGQNALWKRMWFHKWLVQNAGRFKVNPLHSAVFRPTTRIDPETAFPPVTSTSS